MKIRQIIDALEDFAPLALQDGFDNAGLQIGLPQDVDATGVLLCLDVTEAIIDEAVSRGCNMVVSHHPLLFHPLKSISGKDYVERVVIKAIQKGITLYAAHTNLDNAPGGVNHKMAEKLQLASLEWLEPKQALEGGSGLVGELPTACGRITYSNAATRVRPLGKGHLPCRQHSLQRLGRSDGQACGTLWRCWRFSHSESDKQRG